MTAEDKANREQAAKTPDAKKAWIVADDCINCGACENVCPTNAIAPGDRARVVDRGLCIGDGACVSSCPVDCIKIGPEDPKASSG